LRKILLTRYKVEVVGPQGKKASEYDVKSSIESVLLATGPNTEQKLSMVDLLRNARIAEKIKNSKDFILLEEAEFNVVKASFDAYKGFGQFEVELCRRIAQAEQVEVSEKGNP